MSDLRETYKVLTEEEKQKVANIKSVGGAFLVILDTVGNVTRSRELALAKTKLEEAVMWATKAVTA